MAERDTQGGRMLNHEGALGAQQFTDPPPQEAIDLPW